MIIKISDKIFNKQFSKIKCFEGTATLTIDFEMDYLVTVNRRNKDFFEKVQEKFEEFNWIIAKDISILCVTYLSWSDKNFTDTIPDIENISYSFLKALIGFKGLFIDSSQYKDSSNYFIEKTESYKKHLTRILINLKYTDIIRKEDLIFVRCYQKLCHPINKNKLYELDGFLKEISVAKFPPKLNEVSNFHSNKHKKYYSIASIHRNFPKSLISTI